MAKKKKSSNAIDGPMVMDGQPDEYSEWRVKDALRCIQEAHGYMNDSKMMGKVKALAKEQKEALEIIEDMGKGIGDRNSKRKSLEELVD